MGAIRRTQCRVCGAPREEGSHDVLCLEHRRERDRMERRRQRGVPMDLPAPKPREFPRGSCRQCGGVVEKQGLCREHRLEYQRAWAEAERRRKGMSVKGKYGRRGEPKPVELKAPKVPKPIKPRPFVEDVLVIVGPEAFPPLKPVDVSGYDLTRWKAPGIIAEEEERERSWAAWFEARGL